ncbi:hypothetical protein [Microbacterium sp. WCS2018Hpa-9]|uniref:hypothetical protein n=1 Tax=Microbacterium sp. WCS2018Hpa-9 TaxID=3073635 RepID=UPI0028897F1A|nr:hypothetical protein [Microbacterium sp. WCS2018Hpa-9]
MIARRSPIILLALGASVAMLTGCASGGDAGFCGPLHDEHETAAVAFAPLIPGMNTEADVQSRLDLVEKVEPTPELAGDLDVWKGYLTVAADSITDDATAVIDAYDDDVAASGQVLSDYYTGTCLQ